MKRVGELQAGVARCLAVKFRWRALQWRFLRGFSRLTLLGLGLWSGVAGVRFFLGDSPGIDSVGLAGLTVVAAAVALVGALWGAPPLAVVARTVDALAVSHDRLSAGLELETRKDSSRMSALALEEISEFLSDKSRFHPPRLRVPREFLWIPVPAIALGVIAWSVDLREKKLNARRGMGPAAAVAETLERLASETRALQPEESRQREDDAAAQLAEDLEKAAKELAAQTTATPSEQQAAALKALSAAEAALNRNATTDLTDAQRAALQAALESVPGGEAAAQALSGGDNASAAEAMEEFARRADETAMSQFAQGLNDAARRLPDEQRRQMQSDGTDEARRAMQNAAQRMAQRGGSIPEQQRTRMNRTVSGLKQDVREGGAMAFAEPDGGRSGVGNAEEEERGIPSTAAGYSQSMPTDGTEDTGTTENPYGAGTPLPGEGGGEAFVEGQQDEGEVLRAMSLRRADDARTQRAYRNVYEAAAAGAEESVVREQIPQGLRTTVREYFERIRPQE